MEERRRDADENDDGAWEGDGMEHGGRPEERV